MIKGLLIPISDDELMKDFESASKTYFDKIKSNQAQIHNLENLRRYPITQTNEWRNKNSN